MTPQLIRTLDQVSIYELEQRFAIRALAHFGDGVDYASMQIVGLRRVIEMSVRFINTIIRAKLTPVPRVVPRVAPGFGFLKY